jgi:hypothetical protein
MRLSTAFLGRSALAGRLATAATVGLLATLSAPVPAAAGPITISGVQIFKDNSYSSSIEATSPGRCSPRNLLGSPGTLITATEGGVDGFDCGINLPVETFNPGLVNVTGTQDIFIGEAALNERALITPGLFPVGDVTSLDNLSMVIAFLVNGTLVQFNGEVTVYQGGAPASGDPVAIAACMDPTQTTFIQCVSDAALDYRLTFTPSSVVSNVVAIGADQYTFSIPSLDFFDNDVIPIVARVELASTVDEPGTVALLATAMLSAAFMRRLRRRGR